MTASMASDINLIKALVVGCFLLLICIWIAVMLLHTKK